MRCLLTVMCCGLFSSLAAPTMTHAESLPVRATPIPQTTDPVLHVQIGVDAVPELAQALMDHVAGFPGVNLGPARVSTPGGIGFQLDEDMALARPDVIVGGRESARLHTYGGLHASLSPDVALAGIEAGWARVGLCHTLGPSSGQDGRVS